MNIINFVLLCACFGTAVVIITTYAAKKKAISAFATTMTILFILLTMTLSFITFSPIQKGKPIHISELADNGKIYSAINPPDSLFNDINSPDINNPDILIMVTLQERSERLTNKVINTTFISRELMILDQEIISMDSYFVIEKIDISPWKYAFVPLKK